MAAARRLCVSGPASIAHSGHCRFVGVHARALLAHTHHSTPHWARCCDPALGRCCTRSSQAHLVPIAPSSTRSLLLQSAHSQVCRLVHGKKGCTGTKAWLAEFITPAFTNAVCKLHDVLRLARTSGHYMYPCDDQVRPLARAARNESVPVHLIECPPGTARPSAVHSHCAPCAHISDLI